MSHNNKVTRSEFIEYILKNDLKMSQQLIFSHHVTNADLIFSYYMACNLGYLDIVKIILNYPHLKFDKKEYGRSLIEYGIQAASNGKAENVLNYLTSNYKIS